MATGENRSTWGSRANSYVFRLLEDAISGNITVDMANANATLTANQGATDQARNMVVRLVGANTEVRDVIIPDTPKVYIIHNSVSNGHAIRVVNTLDNITIANGAVCLVWTDGLGVFSSHDITVPLTFTPEGRNIIAGDGLTGGGDMTADRTLNVGAGSGISVTTDDVAVDSTVIRTTGDQSMAGIKEFTGQVSLADGSAGSPALRFSNGTTDGLYRVGAGQWAVSIGGTARVTYGSGEVTLGNNVAIAFAGSGAATTRTNMGIGSMATRNVTISSSDPSGGSNGDVWLKI